MRIFTKLAAGLVVAATALGAVVFTYPPHRTLDADMIVESVVNEEVVPSFAPDRRPEVEWTDGARRFWSDYLPSVRFYGVDRVEDRDRLLLAFSSRLKKMDLPGIQITFFDVRSGDRPPREIRRFAVVR